MTRPYANATRLFLLCAALFGAAGVALQAAGTHLASAGATTAGQFLLFHAAAILALAGLRHGGVLSARACGLAIGILVLGTALFAADLALRGLYDAPLFHMAAPIGGSLMLLGWLAVAVAILLP